jgi:hypothetical protein
MKLPQIAKWLIVLTVAGLICSADPVVAEPKQTGGSGRAEFVPIKLVGVGSLNGDGTFQVQGDGTHLGKWINQGTVQFLTPDEDGILLAQVLESVFVGSNRDQLKAALWEEVGGYLNTNTGAGMAMYQFQGGTGRFQNAHGSALLMVQFLPTGFFIAVLEGTISLPALK